MRALIVVVSGLLSLHEAAPAAWADEWIVDDASAAVHLNGTWERSSTTPGFYGANYLMHAPGGGPATVDWPFPRTASPGQYTVYVRYTSGANRASAAVYHIAASNVAADVKVNQQVGGGTWHRLGTFTFESRRGQEVSLSGQADGVVVADAVAWAGPLGTEAAADLTDLDSSAPVQDAVNAGDQPWRLDPVAVARAEATTLGLASSDPMRLTSVSAGAAVVRVQHESNTYDVQLTQPARPGPSGIWVVDSMHRVGNNSD